MKALTSAARRTALRRRLLRWYDACRRPLPWRAPQGAADPYRTWLAEVMLQQTRAEVAAPYWRRFLERFPALPDLATASEEEVLALWAGLGYYARGRNLLAAARLAVARHGGLPASLADLRALPGLGPYTAGAVASIAFGIRAAAVDGNATRVLSRILLHRGRPEGAAARARVAAAAEALVPEDRPGDWNQALMELGATVCGRTPACGRCPVAPLCRARRSGLEREVPPPRPRPPPRVQRVACALVERRGALLLVRRASRGLFGGLWELPSAEVAWDEQPAEALRREAHRRHGVPLRVGPLRAALERSLTHRRLRLEAYGCRLRGRAGGSRHRWFPREALAGMAISTAMRRLVEAAAAK